MALARAFTPTEWNFEIGTRRIFRGMSAAGKNSSTFFASPTKRTPRHMRISDQEFIDDWFENKFGIRFRERGVFCTGDFLIAKNYGVPHIVTPHCDFFFCWSPNIGDLYIEHDANCNKSLRALLEEGDYRCDGLAAAAASGNEIILVGERFEATVAASSK